MSKRLSVWTSHLLSVHNRSQQKVVPVPVAQNAEPARFRERLTPTEPHKTHNGAQASAQQAQVQKPQEDHLSVYATPDAWPRKFKETREAKDDHAESLPGRPRLQPNQRRRNSISIAMSEDEERAIRQAVARAGISLSDWARIALFKYMGRDVPERNLSRRNWEKTGEK